MASRIKDIPLVHEVLKTLHYDRSFDAEKANTFKVEFRDFRNRYKHPSGIPGLFRPVLHKEVHRQCIDDMARVFLDKEKFGEKFWPSDPSSVYKNALTYSEDTRKIRTNMRHLIYRWNVHDIDYTKTRQKKGLLSRTNRRSGRLQSLDLEMDSTNFRSHTAARTQLQSSPIRRRDMSTEGRVESPRNINVSNRERPRRTLRLRTPSLRRTLERQGPTENQRQNSPSDDGTTSTELSTHPGSRPTTEMGRPRSSREIQSRNNLVATNEIEVQEVPLADGEAREVSRGRSLNASPLRERASRLSATVQASQEDSDDEDLPTIDDIHQDVVREREATYVLDTAVLEPLLGDHNMPDAELFREQSATTPIPDTPIPSREDADFPNSRGDMDPMQASSVPPAPSASPLRDYLHGPRLRPGSRHVDEAAMSTTEYPPMSSSRLRDVFTAEPDESYLDIKLCYSVVVISDDLIRDVRIWKGSIEYKTFSELKQILPIHVPPDTSLIFKLNGGAVSHCKEVSCDTTLEFAKTYFRDHMYDSLRRTNRRPLSFELEIGVDSVVNDSLATANGPTRDDMRGIFATNRLRAPRRT